MRTIRNIKNSDSFPPPEENGPDAVLRREVMEEIWRSLQRIEYGEVGITVHDRRIVQIEKREKIRFPK